MPSGIFVRTEIHKKHISESLMGKHLTEEHKRNIGLSHKGQIPWNKDLTKETNERVKKQGESEKGKFVSKETRLKLSSSHKGKPSPRKGKKYGPLSIEHRRKISSALKGEKAYWYGRNHSEVSKQKISKSQRGKKLSEEHKRKVGLAERGSKHHNWKGGITPLLSQIYNSKQNSKWRFNIFTRDSFTCQNCGDNKGGNLEAHHKLPVGNIVQKYKLMNVDQALKCEILWDTNNGITLCEKCHQIIYHNHKCYRFK